MSGLYLLILAPPALPSTVVVVTPSLNITNLSNLKPSISSSVTCSDTAGKWEDFQTMQNMILFMLSAVFAGECLVCGGGGGGGVYLPRYQL